MMKKNPPRQNLQKTIVDLFEPKRMKALLEEFENRASGFDEEDDDDWEEEEDWEFDDNEDDEFEQYRPSSGRDARTPDPKALMPECDPAWFEPLPPKVPSLPSLEALGPWLQENRIPLSPEIPLSDLLGSRYFYIRRASYGGQSGLVRLGELTDPKKLQMIYTGKKDRLELFSELVRALDRHAYAPAITRNVETLRERFHATAVSNDTIDALFSIWDRMASNGFVLDPVADSLFVGGLKRNESIFVFRGFPSNIVSFHPRYTRGDVQIGLWADRPEEMLFSCRCGGRIEKPCAHLFLGLERLLDGLVDPAHSAHAALKARAASPHWELLSAVLRNSFSPESAESRAPAAERVIWRFTGIRRPWDVEPALQTLGKRGKWSKGRRLDPYRAKYEMSGFTTDADQRILNAFDAEPYYLLKSMEGHPAIFHESRPDDPIRVQESPISLSVRKEDDHVRIGFEFGGRRYTGREIAKMVYREDTLVAFFDANAGCLFFSGVTSSQIDLVDALGTAPSMIPEAHLPEVIDTLCKGTSKIPVHFDKALRGETTAPNLTPILRLTPEGNSGLFIALGFHLFGDELFTIPGEGPDYLLRGVKGKPTGLTRNLDEEHRLATDIADFLHLDALPRGGNPFEYLTVAVNDTVELLAAIRDLPYAHKTEWPKGKTPWTVSEISARDLRLQISSNKGALFEIGLDIQLDDERLGMNDISAALEGGTRYLVLGPGRFARIEEALLATLEDLNAVSLSKNKQSLQISRAAAVPLVDRLSTLGEASIAADKSWQSLVADIKTGSRRAAAVPSTFKGELRGYQLEGFRWLSRLRALGLGGCLADDMGLGKTVQALALLLSRRGKKPSLVVAPTSVAPNWMRECRKFAPTLKPLFHHGTSRNADFASLGGSDLVITTYEILVRDIESFAAVDFDTMIVDEAQVVKNATTKRSAAVREVSAEAKLALTGTPIENHLGELWSIFDATVPGLLGGPHQFQRRFGIPIQKHNSAPHRERLAALIRPFVLRRTKLEAAPELPPRTETVRYVELYEGERKQYEIFRRAVLLELESGKRKMPTEKDRFNILAHITKLRRMACHARLADEASVLPSAKLDATASLVGDILEEKARALIFSQFVSHLALLRERLDENQIPYFYLDGSTPAEARGVMMDEWLGEKGNLFLISLKAGGTGLNLTGADYVLHLDPWWNPAVEDQATDRTHRIGQTKPVTVVRIIASATIEEAVIALHEKKRDLAESILSGTGTAATLSTDELINLIRGVEEG